MLSDEQQKRKNKKILIFFDGFVLVHTVVLRGNVGIAEDTVCQMLSVSIVLSAHLPFHLCILFVLSFFFIYFYFVFLVSGTVRMCVYALILTTATLT